MSYKINIYKIYWDDNDDIYIGSTKTSLENRIKYHRYLCRKGRTCKINLAINKYGIDNFKYDIIKTYDVTNNTDKLKLEQKHMDILKPNLNMYRAYNTDEDTKRTISINKAKYYINNREKILKYKAEYYQLKKLKNKNIDIVSKNDV